MELIPPNLEPKTLPASESKLLEIKGLDALKAIRRVGNDWELYEQMLSMFVQDFANYDDVFVGYIEKGEWEEAHRYAHTLKGLAATLGISQIPDLAANLELACKNQNKEIVAASLMVIKPVITPVIKQLMQFFALQDNAKIAASVPENQPIVHHTDKLPACLATMVRLLAEGDADIIDMWNEHKQEFNGLLNAQSLHKIGVALQNFEFDSAHELLVTLQHEHNSKGE